ADSTTAHDRLHPRSRTSWGRPLLLVALGGGLALVVASEALHDLVLHMLAATELAIAEHPVLGASTFVLLAALSAMLAFVSSAVLVPVAVYAWGVPTTVLLLWVGWIVGGLCAYGIGRLLGRPVVSRLMSRAALAQYEDRVTKHAPFRVVLLFQLALPSEIPGYVLGLAGYELRKYVLALALVELPFAIGTVSLGVGLLERRTAVVLGITLLGAIFGLWALRALHAYLSS
ncbi:MAG TPA: VTT domain-containing protein, partial [Gemmatimonadaceae bacterium]|nr:VTT domain-containing protein [Gemmatimonadaceae bacterium]